ncbi:unnamed protein product [Citrullus colocynthis]|uniref:Transmembrane protein n=1 Tax=Citrullus colocynthis TaxID=252529 RepID=A0ABP0YFK8_9ROSI
MGSHFSIIVLTFFLFFTPFLVLLMGGDSNLLVGYRENAGEFEGSECVFGICMNNAGEAFGKNWGRGFFGVEEGILVD